MKKILILAGIIFINLRPLAFAEINSVSLEVKGLSCPFCALGLEKQLKEIQAVEKVDVHLKKGRTDLTLKPGQPFDLKAIQKAVKESGFTLENIHVEISGVIEGDEEGMLVLVSTGDNERFLLFDESHKENETKEFLKAQLKDQLLSAQRAGKTVMIKGVIHEHADLPAGLMIQQIKVE